MHHYDANARIAQDRIDELRSFATYRATRRSRPERSRRARLASRWARPTGSE